MNNLCRFICLLALAFPLTATAEKAHPDCTGNDNWPAAMALGYLMNDVVDRHAFDQIIDYSKVKVERLSSISIGRDKNLSKAYNPAYRQIHHITFYKKSGEILFEAITDGTAYQVECSGKIAVYQISRTFGD